MTDKPREVPFRRVDGPDGLFEDRSLTGSLIDGLERKVWRAQGDTQHRSPHLSEAEKREQCDAQFAHHIAAWNRPALALTTRLDGDDPGRHIHPVVLHDDDDRGR